MGKKFLFSCFPRAGFFSSARIVEVMEWTTGKHRLQEGKMEEEVNINTGNSFLFFSLLFKVHVGACPWTKSKHVHFWKKLPYIAKNKSLGWHEVVFLSTWNGYTSQNCNAKPSRATCGRRWSYFWALQERQKQITTVLNSKQQRKQQPYIKTSKEKMRERDVSRSCGNS